MYCLNLLMKWYCQYTEIREARWRHKIGIRILLALVEKGGEIDDKNIWNFSEIKTTVLFMLSGNVLLVPEEYVKSVNCLFQSYLKNPKIWSFSLFFSCELAGLWRRVVLICVSRTSCRIVIYTFGSTSLHSLFYVVFSAQNIHFSCCSFFFPWKDPWRMCTNQVWRISDGFCTLNSGLLIG